MLLKMFLINSSKRVEFYINVLGFTNFNMLTHQKIMESGRPFIKNSLYREFLIIF